MVLNNKSKNAALIQFMDDSAPPYTDWVDVGLHRGVVVSTVASQQEGARLEFACSPHTCVGSLPLSKNMHVGLIGDS